jgi:hypothetical protein
MKRKGSGLLARIGPHPLTGTRDVYAGVMPDVDITHQSVIKTTFLLYKSAGGAIAAG